MWLSQAAIPHPWTRSVTWPAPEGIARYVLSPGKGWDPAGDKAASRTVRAAFGQCMYRASLHELERALQPEIVWYFEVEALRRAGFPGHTPVVLDHCDVRWRKQTRLAGIEKGRRQKALAWLKAAALRFDDVQLALRVGHSLVASPDEVSLLRPARTRVGTAQRF